MKAGVFVRERFFFSSIFSDLDVRPGGRMISSWVEFGWICELIVVIFHVQSSLGGLTNLDELINVLLVGEVLVKVILEVLDHIHVLLDEIISSDLLEWESVIIKLPSFDGDLWVFSFSLKGFIDSEGVIVVLFIEFSREEIELNIKLGLGKSKRKWASVNEDLVVNNSVSELGGVLNLNGLGSEGNKSQKCDSHHFIIYIINLTTS